MCGIAGYIGMDGIDEGRIAAALALMKNRGPDHQSYASFRFGGARTAGKTGSAGGSTRCAGVFVTLLHSRLSIIDPEPRSNQPFTIGDCTMVFNGEIYNYVELRRRLQTHGIAFETKSDTEVLLRSYLLEGPECVHEFEGMWALAIFDRRRGTLFLSRDRFAEKPLYYLRTKRGLFFGSEVKFIRALAGRRFAPNTAHLSRYLVNGYKSLYKTEDTFYEGLREVPYATSLTVNHNLEIRSARYWTPTYQPTRMTMSQAVEGVRERLRESVRLRLRADVPLAFCLSGGVDSGALASIAAKEFGHSVHAFSIIDPDPRYDESANIQATVDDLACAHTSITLEQSTSLAELERLIRYHDAPIYTISYYIHAMLSRAMADCGFKVAISGTAADELLTGYFDHFNLHLYEMRRHPQFERLLSDWQTHVRPTVRNPFLRDPDLYITQPHARQHVYLNSDHFASFLTREFHELFCEESYCDSLLRNRMMNEMFHEVVPAILHEDDLNSMSCSIENRSPYLDSHLFEFAHSIPPEHLIRDGYAKFVLREALEGILNDRVRTDRRKVGFNASIGSVFDLGSPQVLERILDAGPIFEIVHRDKVESLARQREWTNSESKFLFNFMNAKIFLELQEEDCCPAPTAGVTCQPVVAASE